MIIRKTTVRLSRLASFEVRFLLAVAGYLGWLACTVSAQSTSGTVLGTVADPSGSVVPQAKVELFNTGTNAVREETSSSNGAYQFNNVEVGTYQLRVDVPGFQKANYRAFDLTARETVRFDINLQVTTQASAVTVQASASTVQADTSSIAETKGSRELNDLPVAIGERSQGSTSAYFTLTAQPGVQTDGGAISVSGGTASMVSFTIDGIAFSSVGGQAGYGGAGGGRAGGALTELFPSFNGIEEIKISENLNPAEFGSVADITTVTKSGTNSYHGGFFENFQNSDMNAADTFSHETVPVKMNDFGVYLGGPVVIPGLYNGRNKTFFFGDFEVLRLPKSTQAIVSVPTEAMLNGNLTAYDGTTVPKSLINPFSLKLAAFFWPLPNYGPPGAITNNLLVDYQTPINSAQTDLRIDQVITPKQTVYVRWTYKNKRLESPVADPNGNLGSPLIGTFNDPEVYNALVAAHTWVISPTLVNELRGGYSRYDSKNTTVKQLNAAQTLGLTSPPLPSPVPDSNQFPAFTVAGYVGAISPSGGEETTSNTYQITDTTTWTKGKHTMKFGGNFKQLSGYFCCSSYETLLGRYYFNGSANLGMSPFSGFLQGYPDSSDISSILNPDASAYTRQWAVFAQDDWKVSKSLTINYGLRWEYNPGFRDHLNNMGNWDPNYTSTVNGQVVHGAMVIPNQAAYANVNPLTAATISPIPIVTAAQAGLPQTLVQNNFGDFAPRIGFAYALGNNNKTVIRGGYGRYVEDLQGSMVGAEWSVESLAFSTFNNSLGSNGKPIYQVPYSYPSNIAQPGTYSACCYEQTNRKDPIVEEWDLTLERDLGKGFGARASYTGNHSYHVPVDVDLDQVQPNTLGFSNPITQATAPFPQVAYLPTTTDQGFGHYNDGTISIHRRGGSFQFESSYTYTRNLSNVNGATSTSADSFVDESGRLLSNYYDPALDYGNVPFSRRHRFLTTFLYELPFGKGRAFLNNANGVLDRIVGGFQLSGVLLFQSGPFMTVTQNNDPSGTGLNIYGSNGGRADTVPGINPYAGQSLNQWINPAAFAIPASAIGRFGDATSGSLVGPGTDAVSVSLIKNISFTERLRLQVGAQVANLLNHPNYAPPSNLNLSNPGFGQITSLQTAEGAGPRQIQLTARFIF
jgi:hypothetical protein